MKYRESGMPEENMWQTFFDPVEILKLLEVNKSVNTLLDIGSGYGTFLLPAAKLVSNKVVGIDIEREMINICENKIKGHKLKNIDLILGDISTKNTINDLKDYQGNIDYICLFNILHCENPLDILNAAYSLLNDNGKIGVIHWKNENTPRGPSMEIRPTPEMINKWAVAAGFYLYKQIELPPYHYGMVFIKKHEV
ncbi:class I SAM-dependent methyltransferase [Mobilitalea sibirica]|uniref:Class I SAM-dependent methyltransferase n=1 Tax=Mobilitalea sibirica TaxID=1462919 RepID=A0A8J7H728_9FIRM|nr:class I SAM-dependent methyltransferase [Mobilitalea sibirica]MBH1940891.1 class I SAM-dependent methyltransferase [Mobilitalea sibirica]